jgi:hypothetical protein
MLEENKRIFNNANLTQYEAETLMPRYVAGELEFLGTTVFEKLFEYFAFETGDMPYGVAKARTDTPDNWILEFIENNQG